LALYRKVCGCVGKTHPKIHTAITVVSGCCKDHSSNISFIRDAQWKKTKLNKLSEEEIARVMSNIFGIFDEEGR